MADQGYTVVTTLLARQQDGEGMATEMKTADYSFQAYPRMSRT